MVAAMRAYLAALQIDSEQALDDSDRQFLALLKADRIEGLGELLLAAFTIAARRRFSPTWSSADIVRFIADVRSRTNEMAALLAPAVAENQLRLALGAELTPYPDMEARGRAQMLLLGLLTSNHTPHELDALLSDARALADEATALGGER
jgi:hypothetical protein